MNTPIPGNLISVADVQDSDALPLLTQNGYVSAKNLRNYMALPSGVFQPTLLFATFSGTLASIASAPATHTFPAGTIVSLTPYVVCLANDALSGYVAGDVIPLALAEDGALSVPLLGASINTTTNAAVICLAGGLANMSLPKTDGSGYTSVTSSTHFGFSVGLVYF